MAATGRSRPSDVNLLRETILRHMHRRVGKTFAELMVDVQDDYGSVGERRLYRQLSHLVEVGCASRSKDALENWDRVDSCEDGRAPLVYFYRLLTDEIPRPQTSFCKLCGAVGTRTSSHPLHLSLRRHMNGKPFEYIPLKRAGRQPSAGSPGSPLPAGSADRPDRPRRAARRAS